jgi:hypothetical protein
MVKLLAIAAILFLFVPPPSDVVALSGWWALRILCLWYTFAWVSISLTRRC